MRKLIGILLIAALLLTGCQMAREEEKTTADPLVGALITTLNADEDWDGDRLDAENGKFAFGKAVLFPTVDDTICITADDCFDVQMMSVHQTGDDLSNEARATMYIDPRGGAQIYRVNPVYQQADGAIYALRGNGCQIDADGEGSKSTMKLESTAARTENGKRVEETGRVEISFETKFPTVEVRILEMNAGGIAAMQTFAAESLPEAFAPDAGTEYLIAESKNENGGVSRQLIEKDGSTIKIQVSGEGSALDIQEIRVDWE